MRGASRNPQSGNGGYWLKPVDYEHPSLQERVYAWRTSVYGPIVRAFAVIEKSREELSEYSVAVWNGTQSEPSEAADIVIVLMGRAQELGYDLMAEVEKKLAIVEKRTKEEQLERDARK